MKRPLQLYITALHHSAGAPSTRIVAQLAGCSHTTVAEALSGRRQPSIETLLAIARALGGRSQDVLELVGPPDRPVVLSKQANRELLSDILDELREIRKLLEART